MNNKGKYLGIRISAELKKELETFCDDKGVSQSSVLYYLMKKSVDEKKLPFSEKEIYMLESKSSNGKNPKKVSLRIKDESLKEKFKLLCSACGVDMAGAIKLYFRKCIEKGDIPF